MNIEDFFGSGLSGFYEFSDLLFVSQDYSVPEDGRYLFIASGGGGSGAYNAVYNKQFGIVSGGASGFVKKTILKLSPTDTISITIGAGGSAVTADSGGCSAGVAGGTTTIGNYLSANGGDGGVPASASHLNSKLVNGYGYKTGRASIGFDIKDNFNLIINTSNGVEYGLGGGASILHAGGLAWGDSATDYTINGQYGSGGGSAVTPNKHASQSGKGGDGFVAVFKIIEG